MSDTAFTVRRGRPSDAGAIADVHTRSWQAGYEHIFGAENLRSLDRVRRRRWWERTLADEVETVLVAELDGAVVAFTSVGASREQGADGELYAIYALPAAWGTGVAAALMAAGVDALHAAGYCDAILYVLEDNPRARRFYEREGWMPDGRTKHDEFFGIRVTEVRYRRCLAPVSGSAEGAARPSVAGPRS